MSDTAETESRPAPTWYLDRASRRDEADREVRYQDWLHRRGLDDTPERRALHFRRYRRPNPPTL